MDVAHKVLLAIGSEAERRAAARTVPPDVEILEASDCSRARDFLRAGHDVAVIVCDLTLRDGSWWCIYQEIVDRQQPPELIVLLPERGVDSPEVEAHGVAVVAGRPIDVEELSQALRKAVAQAGLVPRASAGR